MNPGNLMMLQPSVKVERIAKLGAIIKGVDAQSTTKTAQLEGIGTEFTLRSPR
jgi:hypothetical protein